MQPLLEVLQKTATFFEKKGVEHARLNAELIFAHVLKCKRLDLYLQFERPMKEEELDTLRPLVKRRGMREPLQYVLGDAPFCDLTLKVDARVLIPRPETEEWVNGLCLYAKTPPGSIVDLGTGSGAIALALAQHFAEADVVAVDVSKESLALAQENAVANGLEERVRFVESDWWLGLGEETFDWIVSNPPYLTEEEWNSAAVEVKEHEPKHALTASEEGLADLRKILEGALTRLNEGGLVALETGVEHHQALEHMAKELGYASVESRKDLNGFDRFFVAYR